MLQWLAGHRPPDSDFDVDTTGYIEPPETPAPVFAVRAFKHAIFGTPQTTPKKHRSQSNTEPNRPKLDTARPARPNLSRPKSVNDARASSFDGPPPLPSPTKGILMTPGTAAGRRKTVSFGDHVIDNETKGQLAESKSGLPEDCPGKFPSPWIQQHEKPDLTVDHQGDGHRGRSKLTEELHKIREDSAKKRRLEMESAVDDGVHNTAAADGAATGSYEQLRQEYDEYRSNTQREVRKLVTKQKAAKSYAKEKDAQCVDLRDQLCLEKRNVERLEKRSIELETQARVLRDELQAANARQRPSIARSAASSDTHTGPDDVPDQHRALSKALQEAQEESSNLRMDNQSLLAELRLARAEIQKLRALDKPSLARDPPRPEEKAWQPVSSIAATTAGQPVDIHFAPQLQGRTVTSGTGATPLKSLSINTLAAESDRYLTSRSAQSRKPEQDRSPERRERASRPTRETKRKDSYDFPSHGENKIAHEDEHPLNHISLPKRVERTTAIAPFVDAVPPSNPLQDTATVAPTAQIPRSEHRHPPTAHQQPSPPTTAAKAAHPPSKQWQSLSKPGVEPPSGPTVAPVAPTAGKRLVSKEGREISAERVAEIRAKMEAKRAARAAATVG